jgi:hypothetical protein
MKVDVAARGRPFTMRPDLEATGVGNTIRPSATVMLVEAPGFEDWAQLTIERKASGWRSYRRETIESYSLAWGRGGHCLHYRYHAIRSNGRLLGASHNAAAALSALQRVFLADTVDPA